MLLLTTSGKTYHAFFVTGRVGHGYPHKGIDCPVRPAWLNDCFTIALLKSTVGKKKLSKPKTVNDKEAFPIEGDNIADSFHKHPPP
jgi:hypothetical protein